MSIYVYDYLCQVQSYLQNCESYEYIQQSFHDLRILHLFEQYMTDFQFNLHFFLQLNGLLHTGHTLVSVFSLPNTRDILLYHNLWGSVHSIPHKVYSSYTAILYGVYIVPVIIQSTWVRLYQNICVPTILQCGIGYLYLDG